MLNALKGYVGGLVLVCGLAQGASVHAWEVKVERLEPPKLEREMREGLPVSKVTRGTCYWYGKIRGAFVATPVYKVGMVSSVCRRQSDFKRGRPAFAEGKLSQSDMKKIYDAGKG